jgi:8-oxo-dGTP pyrophosphatase MutT (NUDIX family)
MPGCPVDPAPVASAHVSIETNPEVVYAAGGLVWRPSSRGPELILIHRTRYGPEWALPKGKLDPGESWTVAALREVAEETGCIAGLGDFAGGNIYTVDGTPKVVLYWHMILQRQEAVTDTREVSATRWLTVPEALALLTRANERELLSGPGGTPPSFAAGRPQ